VGFRAISQPLLQALTLAALWRGLRYTDRRRAFRWLLLAGVLCGLTGYTYLAARAFPIPIALALAVLLVLDRGHRRERLAQATLFGLTALVVFTPLGLYFLQHPGAFTNRMAQVGPGGDWGAALDGIVAALKMLFIEGDPYVRFNLPYRPLFGPVIGVFWALGVAITGWRLFSPDGVGGRTSLSRARECLLLSWIPAMLLPTALAVGEITPSNLRAIGLIPLIFLLPARGLRALLTAGLSRRWMKGWLLIVTTGLVLILLTANVAQLYFGEYVSRTDLYEASDGDLADIARYLNQRDVAGTSVYVSSIHYRHPTVAFLAEDYAEIKWLVGASTIVYPPRGQALYLFPRSAMPNPDWLTEFLPDMGNVESLRAPDGAAAFGACHLERPPHLEQAAIAQFSGIIELLGYQVERAISGQGVVATVTWRILAPSPYADTIPFYHLEDPWGERWGQAEPFHYASEDWAPGEVVISRVYVPVLPGAPPGDYFLKVGLYSPSAGQRLAVVGEDGGYAGTTVPLPLSLARAETQPERADLTIRRAMDLETEDGLTLLGANLDTAQVRPGERIHLTLFWRASPSTEGRTAEDRIDYTVELTLQGPQADPVVVYRDAPVHGTYSTSQWEAGDVVVDRYNPRVPLDATNAPPGEYDLIITLRGSDDRAALGPAVLGRLTLLATDRSFQVPDIQHSQQAELGDQAELLGYDLGLANAEPGGTIHLTLYWRALAEMTTSYTVFTHVLGQDGQIVAQQDNPPVNGTYPTILWLPGEVVQDPYNIGLPEDLASGDYPIEVGFYIASNGLQLGDTILLDTVISVRR
jgi:hypothetical protein